MKSRGQIVGLEVAKLARKAGFDEVTDHGHCFDTVKKGYYVDYDPDYFVNSSLWEKHCSAPTQEQLHAWLRSNKSRIVLIDIANKLNQFPIFYPNVYKCDPVWKNIIEVDHKVYTSYEQAFEEGLKIALESL